MFVVKWVIGYSHTGHGPMGRMGLGLRGHKDHGSMGHVGHGSMSHTGHRCQWVTCVTGQ